MINPGTPLDPEDIISALPAKFEEGKASGELLFFESTAQDVETNGKRVS